MREPQNINDVAALDIDIIGLIFVPDTPRYVAPVSTLAGIIPDLPAFNTNDMKGKVRLAGVFIDGMPQNIVTAVYNYNLDIVQLHGHETPTMIENLKRTLVPDIVKNIKIVKTINVSSADDLKKCEKYEGIVDYFLFDSKSAAGGGSGHKFEWKTLENYSGKTPFLLSGGIKPDDTEAICAFQHPMFAGIDLNSGFETKPGVKDVDKLRTFVEQIRQGRR